MTIGTCQNQEESVTNGRVDPQCTKGAIFKWVWNEHLNTPTYSSGRAIKYAVLNFTVHIKQFLIAKLFYDKGWSVRPSVRNEKLLSSIWAC